MKMFEDCTKRQTHEGMKGNTNSLRRLRRAFSFAEVLFAVIILGIGFIMIAAVFPVAIRQTKTTVDETAAAAIARAGANCIAQYANSTNMPKDKNAITDGMVAIPTYNTASTTPNFTFWQQIRGNIISQDDPRYAYVSMFFRGVDINTLVAPPNNVIAHPYAQVVTICVQATQTSTFSSADYFNSAAGADTPAHRVNLQPRPVQFNIANGVPGDVDLIGFKDSTMTDAWAGATNAVAEGAFVVVRVDNSVTNTGALVGSIYRVGSRRPDMDNATGVPSFQSSDTTSASAKADFTGEQVWELMPGNDFTPIQQHTMLIGGTPTKIASIEAPGDSTKPDEAYIIGRSWDSTTGQFSGPAMDVSAYSTFVAVSQ